MSSRSQFSNQEPQRDMQNYSKSHLYHQEPQRQPDLQGLQQQLEYKIGQIEQNLKSEINELKQANMNLQSAYKNLETDNNELKSRILQLENLSQQNRNMETQSQIVNSNQAQKKRITLIDVKNTNTPNQLCNHVENLKLQKSPIMNINMNGIFPNQSEIRNNYQQQSQFVPQNQNNNREKYIIEQEQQPTQFEATKNQSQTHTQTYLSPTKQNTYYPAQNIANQESPLEPESRLRIIYANCIHCNLPIQSNQFLLSCQHSFHQECILSFMKQQILQEKAKSITCVCHKEIPAEFLYRHQTSIREFDQLYRQLKQNQSQPQIIQQNCQQCKCYWYGQQGNSQFCPKCQNTQYQASRIGTQYPYSIIPKR